MKALNYLPVRKKYFQKIVSLLSIKEVLDDKKEGILNFENKLSKYK